MYTTTKQKETNTPTHEKRKNVKLLPLTGPMGGLLGLLTPNLQLKELWLA